MSASARATSSTVVLFLLLAAPQLNCGDDGEESLPGPGSGVVDTSLDDNDDDDIDVEHEGGGGGGEPLAEECDAEGGRQTCAVYNAYGCIQGHQTCIDGVWSECFFGSDA